MKKNSIYTLLVVFLTAFSLTSCLKDQEDVFDDSASKRLTSYLANVQDVLVSAEHGWAFNYFPDRTQQYGGFTYTLKFDKENVTVTSESDEESFTTLYKLNNESGPCLMVDTYNESFHKFSTPSNVLYEAKDGDNLFLILGVSDDKNTITLKGTRSGNVLYMHRLEENGDDYLKSIKEMSENIMSEFISNNGKIVVALDLDKRQFEILDAETGEYATTAFIISKTGGLFYNPVEFNGREISAFAFDTTTAQLSLYGLNATLEAIVKTPVETFLSKTWFLTYKNLCPSLQPGWTSAANGLKQGFGFDIDYCFVEDGIFDVIFGGGYQCKYTCILTPEDEDVVTIDITGAHPTDLNVSFVESNIPAFKAFPATCNGTFKITPLDKRGSLLMLTKVSDPSVYFTVTTSEVAAF
jgi:hypothetical protein